MKKEIEIEFPNQEEVNEFLHKVLIDIIKNNKPHEWQPSSLSDYDSSGYVVLCDLDDINEIKNNLGKEDYMDRSLLHELLDSLHIDRWEATYVSGCGQHWINYSDLLEEEFRSLKDEIFKPYYAEDEDNEDIDDDEEEEKNNYNELNDLYTDMDELFYNFLDNNDDKLEFYYSEIVKTVPKGNPSHIKDKDSYEICKQKIEKYPDEYENVILIESGPPHGVKSDIAMTKLQLKQIYDIIGEYNCKLEWPFHDENQARRFLTKEKADKILYGINHFYYVMIR
jgi:hypothetical protein